VCFFDAGLLLLKGKLLACMLQERGHEEVEDCYQQALAVARRQQARSLELRAAASLTSNRISPDYTELDLCHRSMASYCLNPPRWLISGS